MKILVATLLGVVLLQACTQPKPAEIIVASPNQFYQLAFLLEDNKPFYQIKAGDRDIIKASALGFELKSVKALLDHFKILKVKQESHDETWEQVWGEQKEVRDHYNSAKIFLQESIAPYRKLNLIFKVYDEGVGFRYEIPKQEGLDSLLITNELTEFNLAENYSTWFIPANFESYEMLYHNKPLSQVASANTPVTFESADQTIFLSIHEANLTDYAGMTLIKKEGEELSMIANLVPWPDGVKVKAKTPMQSPWRTIQIASSAGGLIESSLILNLNEPNKLTDVSWIHPLKYVGVWWGMHLGTNTWTEGPRHGATTKEMFKYIDFAAENNINAVLAEGWNSGWENWGQPKAFDFVTACSDFDLEDIVAYAAKKNIAIIGHHETGGDAPYYEQQMDTAFQRYSVLGMHHLKTGYAGPIQPKGQFHHGQYMVNHYRKVVEKAAEYKLTVNAHEPIKPTGIRRTYPNMMTREGARGMEWNGWSDGNPPEHHVVLPFTRILAGPIDYTPGVFDLLYHKAGKRVKWNDQDKGTSRINTTLAKQLALYVVFYSPMQMACDLVDNYKDQPAFQFIHDVPVNWEYTKVLNAQIGQYITIVRKDINSNDWYLGAVSNKDGRELLIKLDFLSINKKYQAEIYADTKDSDWETNPYPIDITTQELTHDDVLSLKLAPGGGQAIRFKALE
jgi:alpha-glucosidase